VSQHDRVRNAGVCEVGRGRRKGRRRRAKEGNETFLRPWESSAKLPMARAAESCVSTSL
jgi:hypothetical protein